jgi:hypothetical protein
MYSNHGCKDFISILTDSAECVCSKCGFVLEEKVDMGSFVSNNHSNAAIIPIHDENRLGSGNITPPGFTSEKNKQINPINRYIFSARQKPLRMKFTNTCIAVGFKQNQIRMAMYYFDVLHEIRSNLKKQCIQTGIFLEIITAYSKSIKQTDLVDVMVKSKQWKSNDDVKKWLEIFVTKSFDVKLKIKKPKKLSTLNISFFSLYQIACENNIPVNTEEIKNAITHHMHFTREIKASSAVSTCKTFLNLEKKMNVKTPTLKHKIMLESTTLSSEKSKRTFHNLSSSITSKSNAVKIKKELELMS